MTVVVACRAADGTLVFGSDRQYTSEDETHEGKKLLFSPIVNGVALMGMAAEDANRGFTRRNRLWLALKDITFDRDPFIVLQETMEDSVGLAPKNETPEEVEILCGIASEDLPKPKLLGVFDRKPRDLDERAFCCIGSGAGAAAGFLRLASKSLQSLRDAQVAVCTSVWLAKRVDPRCGGLTDIWWLNQHSRGGELDVERIMDLETYIETSLLGTVTSWIASAPL